MIKPRNRLPDGRRPLHRQFRRPVQQHHGDAERARGNDLAVSREAAAVLRDHDIDRMCDEQRPLLFLFEGTSAENVARMRNRQRRIHRIDASNQIVVLGRRSEVRDLLPAQREEHVLGLDAQGAHGLVGIENFGPPITGDGAPWRPAQRNHRGFGLRGGAERMSRDRRRIRMSRINQCDDRIVAEILRESSDPAEAAAPYGYCLSQRRGGAARQRQGRRDIGAGREVLPDLSGLRRTSKNEDMFSHVAR
jgi:hypothetical protein